MLPYLAQIGSVLIPSHAVGWCLAYLIAVIGIFRWGKRLGLDPNLLLNLLLVGTIAELAGARLSAVVMLSSEGQWRWLMDHPVQILKFWGGGMSFYGVMGAGMAAAAWYYLRSGLPALKTTDLIIPWLALGHFIQSFSCLAAGCHYGAATTLPWAVSYAHPYFHGPEGYPLHPFPIYLALVTLSGWFFAHGWVRIKYFENRSWISFYRKYLAHFLRVRFVEGELFPLSGIYYSTGRFLVEFTRSPALQVWYPDWPLAQTQMACIFIFFFSLIGLLCLWAIDDSKKGKTGHDWWLKHLFRMLGGMEWVSKRVP